MPVLSSALFASNHAEAQRKGLHQLAYGRPGRSVGDDEAHRHPAGHLIHLDAHPLVELPLRQLRLQPDTRRLTRGCFRTAHL